MSKRYQQPADGDIVLVKGKRNLFGHKIMCCDCGLVHKFYYRIVSPRLMEFAAERDERATSAARRKVRRSPIVADLEYRRTLKDR